MAQYQMHNPLAMLVWSQAVPSRKTALAIESEVKAYYRRAGKVAWEEGPFGVMVF